MWTWVDRIGAELLDVGVPVLALSGVVALTMIGTRQPARRVRLGRASMFGIAALILLDGFRVVPRYDLIAAVRDLGLVPAVGPVQALTEHTVNDPSHLTRVGRGLTLLYVGALLLGLGRLGLGLFGLSWLTARSVVPAAETAALFESLPLAADRRRPRLRVVGRVRRPGLVGLFRPTILIPTELEQPKARDRLRLCLLHELAHAERADPWFALAGNLAQAVFFFLPPVRWVVSQMRLDQEFLADRRAATGFGQSGEYASSLLGFTSPRRVAGPGAALGAEYEGRSSALFQRVLMLVRCPFRIEPTPPTWWTWCLVGLGLPLALGAACLSVGPAADRTPSHAHAPSGSFTVARLIVPPSPPGAHGARRSSSCRSAFPRNST